MKTITVTKNAQITEDLELEPGDQVRIEEKAVSREAQEIFDAIQKAGLNVEFPPNFEPDEPKATVRINGKRLVIEIEELGSNFFFPGEYNE